MSTKYLAAFDFDHTVVDENTDIVARDLIDSSLIPESVKQLYKSSGWIEYMQEIFNLLHSNGRSPVDIRTAIRAIPETEGMSECIKKLAQSGFEVIVISDSNSMLIDAWCESRIAGCFSEIFTNPARFDDSGRLCLKPYHHQTYCTLSSENLCKGQVLEDFIEKRRQQGQYFESVFYIGDGRNDICPMLRLGENDTACPRVGYLCEKEIENVARKVSKELRANMFRWNTGRDLLDYMLESVKKS